MKRTERFSQKNRRAFLLLCAAILCFAGLAGCRASSPKPASAAEAGVPASLPVLSPDNPVTLTVFAVSNFPEMAKDNRFLKLLKDELGVTLQIELAPSGMDLASKIGTMIASEDLPDLFYCINGSSPFIQLGHTMPLDEWLPIAPNIKRYTDDGYLKMMSNPDDGKLYVLPNHNRFFGEISETDYTRPAFFIQKAVMEEFNFPEIKTLDDYFGIIERYMKKYPTIDGQPTIGFSVYGTSGFLPHLMNPVLHLMGQANNGNMAWMGDHAELYSHSEGAYRYLKILNNLYHRGIMDQEAFTQSNDQYNAKLATGRVLGVFDEGWLLAITSEPALKQAGMHNRTMVGTAPTWPGVAPYYNSRDVLNIEQGYGVNKNSPRRAQAVALINTLLEEKWQKRMTWGEEGIDYLVSPEGRYYRTPEQRANRADTVWRLKNLPECFWDGLPKLEGSYQDGNSFSPTTQPEEWQLTLSDYDREFLRKAGKKTFVEFMNEAPPNPVWYPLWTISLVEGSDAQTAYTEYLESLFQYYSELVMAPTEADFEKVWNSFQNRVKEINTKAYEDRYTEQALIRIRNWS
jgi:putative aldouronate transport system substrate-binding protein